MYWLDLGRFAESDGFKADDVRPTAWRYRDYVIQSLNSDKPYDRFLREQIAGDELYPGDLREMLECEQPKAASPERAYPNPFALHQRQVFRSRAKSGNGVRTVAAKIRMTNAEIRRNDEVRRDEPWERRHPAGGLRKRQCRRQ